MELLRRWLVRRCGLKARLGCSAVVNQALGLAGQKGGSLTALFADAGGTSFFLVL
jgi:hypothetical protein